MGPTTQKIGWPGRVGPGRPRLQEDYDVRPQPSDPDERLFLYTSTIIKSRSPRGNNFMQDTTLVLREKRMIALSCRQLPKLINSRFRQHATLKKLIHLSCRQVLELIKLIYSDIPN